MNARMIRDPKQERRLKRRNTLGSLEISIRHQIVNTLELSLPPSNRGKPPPPPHHPHPKPTPTHQPHPAPVARCFY